MTSIVSKLAMPIHYCYHASQKKNIKITVKLVISVILTIVSDLAMLDRLLN